MSVKIKVRTYYKLYDNNSYYITYTGTKYVYYIAGKPKYKQTVEYYSKELWGTIERWQKHINNSNYKTTVLSKEDVFLELL